jgi:hypothetical protein
MASHGAASSSSDTAAAAAAAVAALVDTRVDAAAMNFVPNLSLPPLIAEYVQPQEQPDEESEAEDKFELQGECDICKKPYYNWRWKVEICEQCDKNKGYTKSLEKCEKVETRESAAVAAAIAATTAAAADANQRQLGNCVPDFSLPQLIAENVQPQEQPDEESEAEDEFELQGECDICKKPYYNWRWGFEICEKCDKDKSYTKSLEKCKKVETRESAAVAAAIAAAAAVAAAARIAAKSVAKSNGAGYARHKGSGRGGRWKWQQQQQQQHRWRTWGQC